MLENTRVNFFPRKFHREFPIVTPLSPFFRLVVTDRNCVWFVKPYTRGYDAMCRCRFSDADVQHMSVRLSLSDAYELAVRQGAHPWSSSRLSARLTHNVSPEKKPPRHLISGLVLTGINQLRWVTSGYPIVRKSIATRNEIVYLLLRKRLYLGIICTYMYIFMYFSKLAQNLAVVIFLT